MGIARLVGLAFLFFILTIARAAEWPAAYPQVADIFPQADAYGEFEGTPPSAAVYQSGQVVGYAFLTSDAVRIPAYSGRPINTLVGLDASGRILGLTIVHHDEPILAVGISQERLNRYVSQYAGKSAFDRIAIGAPRPGFVAIDGISGATITVMVQNATVMRSAKMVAESRGLRPGPEAGASGSGPAARAGPAASLPQDPVTEQARPQMSETTAPAPAPARATAPPRAEDTPATRPATPARTHAGARSGPRSEAPRASTPWAPAGPAIPPVASAGRPQSVDDPDWVAIWKNRTFDIAVLVGGLILLSLVLIFQDWLARDPTLLTYVRTGFNVYTLFFIGWWGLAQLSVINVLTFVNAVMHGFRWENFLIDPMLFILWGFVAVTLLLWGRGVYCGWLCPFGALQELMLLVGRKLKLPEVEFRDAVHERLVALKYVILILLFGVSLQSLAEAAWFTEVEPFKTVIALRFQRDWNYVFYALVLIGVATVNRKFYCKYLCPLGAALAIPGRFRLFEWWLRRRKECGKPCQVCANHCSVRAIRPTGEINANECHYCLDCQVVYYNDRVCLPLIDRRKRREQQLRRGQEVGAKNLEFKVVMAGDNPGGMDAPGKH